MTERASYDKKYEKWRRRYHHIICVHESQKVIDHKKERYLENEESLAGG